jgi:hypothetical protein
MSNSRSYREMGRCAKIGFQKGAVSSFGHTNTMGGGKWHRIAFVRGMVQWGDRTALPCRTNLDFIFHLNNAQWRQMGNLKIIGQSKDFSSSLVLHLASSLGTIRL